MSGIRVLLVDDHPVVREGLRRMLEQEEGVEVVGEAASGEEALALAELLSPDVALVDIKMPGMNGIEAIRQLKEKNPDLNAIVLTLYGDQYLSQAVEAGAVGYLLKDASRQEIIDGIRAVHQGQSAIDAALGRELLAEFATLARSAEAARCPLSKRELEMVRFVASGLTNKEIAARLFLSVTTVRREMRRIFERLGVKDRSEAVSEAYKRGLI